jgi:hypothetical protein
MVLYTRYAVRVLCQVPFRFVKFKAATGDGIAPLLKGTSQTTQFCETVGLLETT